MRKVGDSDLRALLEELRKKNFLNWVKRTIVLCDGRLNEMAVPPALTAANDKILREVPKLVNAIIHFMLEMSSIWYTPGRNQKFMGMTPIQSMIRYQQHFIQGRAHGKPNFQQLDLTPA